MNFHTTDSVSDEPSKILYWSRAGFCRNQIGCFSLSFTLSFAALYIGFASLYPVIKKIPEPRWIRTIDFLRLEAIFSTKLLTHINNIYYILNMITLQYFSFINKSISMNCGVEGYRSLIFTDVADQFLHQKAHYTKLLG